MRQSLLIPTYTTVTRCGFTPLLIPHIQLIGDAGVCEFCTPHELGDAAATSALTHPEFVRTINAEQLSQLLAKLRDAPDWTPPPYEELLQLADEVSQRARARVKYRLSPLSGPSVQQLDARVPRSRMPMQLRMNAHATL